MSLNTVINLRAIGDESVLPPLVANSLTPIEPMVKSSARLLHKINSVVDADLSQFLMINFAINPLVSSAAPLFTLAQQMTRSRKKQNFMEVFDQLYKTVEFFEQAAHHHGYRAQMILAARYILCSFSDQCLAQQGGMNKSLLMAIHGEQEDGKRFLLIVQRCMEDPGLYLDLLELCYICLCLGYPHMSVSRAHESQSALQLIDDIYQLIQHQRGELSKRLLIPAPKSQKNTRQRRSIHDYMPPVWLTVGLAICSVVGLYGLVNHQLERYTEPVQQTILTWGVSNDQGSFL